MRVLNVSDLHMPFHHPGALDFLADLRKEIKPDMVTCTGDEFDAHGWSVHDRLPDAPGQRDELRLAKDGLKQLEKLFPSLLLCYSNHTNRHLKPAARVGLPSGMIRSLNEILGVSKKWKWADRHTVDRNVFFHGEGHSGSQGALTAARYFRKNVVMGHLHSWMGIAYHCNGIDTVWGMNCGCLVDVESYGLAYGKNNKDKPVLGTGAVIDGKPILFPMKA